MMTLATQQIIAPPEKSLSDAARKLWIAARQITNLEYQLSQVKRQRQQMSALIQQLLEEDSE